jgi:hypothetical protein
MTLGIVFATPRIARGRGCSNDHDAAARALRSRECDGDWKDHRTGKYSTERAL